MLCVWWIHCGIIHFEFLKHDQTLNVDSYFQQSLCVDENPRKRSSFDNVRLHSTRMLQEKKLDLSWFILPKPLYSPDDTLNNFYLLSSLSNALNNKNFLKKIRGKCLWKTWPQNWLNFTREESISYLMNGKRWSKIEANRLLIEINSLLNYSWINYIFLNYQWISWI